MDRRSVVRVAVASIFTIGLVVYSWFPPSGPRAVAGDYQLTLTTDRPEYSALEPVEVTAEVLYKGSSTSVTKWYMGSGGPVAFDIRNIEGSQAESSESRSPVCTSSVDLQPGVPYRQGFEPAPLHAGTWEISADVNLGDRERCQGDVVLRATKRITVR